MSIADTTEQQALTRAELDALEARIKSALNERLAPANPPPPSLRELAVQAGAPAEEVDEAGVVDAILKRTNAYTIMKFMKPTPRIFAALARMHLESRQDPWASAQ